MVKHWKRSDVNYMALAQHYGLRTPLLDITTNEEYDLMKDKLFKKVKFRLTEDFCKWIYEEMDCGQVIYPNDEDIARIQDIVHTTLHCQNFQLEKIL